MLLKRILPFFALIVAVFLVVSLRGAGSLDADLLAEVHIDGSASGFVSLYPSEAPNGAYFSHLSGEGEYELRIESLSRGVNPKAYTVIDDIFVIANNGSVPVSIVAEKIGDHADFVDLCDMGAPGDPDRYDFFSGTEEAPLYLAPGQTAHISLIIHAETLAQSENILKRIIFHVDVAYTSE